MEGATRAVKAHDGMHSPGAASVASLRKAMSVTSSSQSHKLGDCTSKPRTWASVALSNTESHPERPFMPARLVGASNMSCKKACGCGEP